MIWNQNYGHIGTGLPYATGAMLADQAQQPASFSGPGMLLTSDSSFLFHVGELEVAVRKNLPLVCVVGVDFQWGLEVGVYKRTFGQGTKETGTHWSDKVRFDKIAEGFGAAGEFVSKAEGHRPGHPARAYERGGLTVIHVPIDPKANSEEMPNYTSASAPGTPKARSDRRLPICSPIRGAKHMHDRAAAWIDLGPSGGADQAQAPCWTSEAPYLLSEAAGLSPVKFGRCDARLSEILHRRRNGSIRLEPKTAEVINPATEAVIGHDLARLGRLTSTRPSPPPAAPSPPGARPRVKERLDC